mgnify:CR=1 FL=1
MEESGVAVGDDEAGAAAEGLEQALARARLGLDEGQVGDRGAGEGVAVVLHALVDEGGEALAGPGVVRAQGLEEHEGLAEGAGAVDGMVEGEVMRRAAGGDHPVEDEVAVEAQRAVVGLGDAERGRAEDHGRPCSTVSGPRFGARLSDASSGP